MTRTAYLEALLALPRLVGAAVSRDGRWVAWTWFGVGPAGDVFCAPTDGSAAPIRLTDTPENTFLVSWTPDSRAVIVEEDKGGNERVQLFRVDLDRPLTMLPLTEPQPGYYVRGGQVHPNGRWLIYGANVDAASGQEIEPTWIYRHDLQTGERTVLARPEKGGWVVPQLSPTGGHVLYNRLDRHPAGEQVWLVDIEGRGDREILNFGDDVKAFASWLPDGGRAIVLAEAKTYRRLGVWRLNGGALRWLVDDPARNIEDAFVPFGSERAVVEEVRAAKTRCSLLDVQTGVETWLPDIPGNLVPLAPLPDGMWVGQYYSSRQPVDLVRFDVAQPDPARFVSLTQVWQRTPLRPADLTQAQEFRWTSVDGLEIRGWLYRPKGQARGTIVYVHGGPTSHSQDRINNQIQLFVHEGFNVLDPNYRGSTGFGLEFQESIKATGWGGREQDDIRTGIEALIQQGIAQAGKVGITGTSYGGYSTWWAATHFPASVVAAAAPICGMTDLVVDYQTTRPDLRPYSEEMLGGRPDQAPERYRERSPIHFVDNIKARLLIVQGMQDPNVTPANVREVRTALERAKIPYDVLAFDDEGHGISRPKNQRTLYLRLLEFFEGMG